MTQKRILAGLTVTTGLFAVGYLAKNYMDRRREAAKVQRDQDVQDFIDANKHLFGHNGKHPQLVHPHRSSDGTVATYKVDGNTGIITKCVQGNDVDGFVGGHRDEKTKKWTTYEGYQEQLARDTSAAPSV